MTYRIELHTGHNVKIVCTKYTPIALYCVDCDRTLKLIESKPVMVVHVGMQLTGKLLG